MRSWSGWRSSTSTCFSTAPSSSDPRTSGLSAATLALVGVAEATGAYSVPEVAAIAAAVMATFLMADMGRISAFHAVIVIKSVSRVNIGPVNHSIGGSVWCWSSRRLRNFIRPLCHGSGSLLRFAVRSRLRWVPPAYPISVRSTGVHGSCESRLGRSLRMFALRGWVVSGCAGRKRPRCRSGGGGPVRPSGRHSSTAGGFEVLGEWTRLLPSPVVIDAGVRTDDPVEGRLRSLLWRRKADFVLWLLL